MKLLRKQWGLLQNLLKNGYWSCSLSSNNLEYIGNVIRVCINLEATKIRQNDFEQTKK